MRRSLKAAGMVALAAACYTPLRPHVTLQPGYSLKNYQAVAVGPVENRTGNSFNYDIEDTLRTLLISAFHEDNVPVTRINSDTAGVLYLVSSLDEFRGGGVSASLPMVAVGSPKCEMSSRMTDAATGQAVGEIKSKNLVDQSTTSIMTPRQLLASCARITADELKRRMQ
jgi:hypothetical protein